MDESREHMPDEEAAFDPSPDDKADAGFDEFASALDSLVARFDEEIVQDSSSLLSMKDMEAFDSLPGMELDEFLSPPTDFDPLVPEIDGATAEAGGNIQAAPLTMAPDFESPADDGAELDRAPLDQAELRQMDSSTALSDTPFEADAMPAFDEMPMFVEQDSENEGEVPDEQSFVAGEGLDETCGVLDSLIANIDSELTLSEPAAGIQAVSHTFTTTSNDGVGSDEEQHVIFTLDGASYSFPIASVTEIGRSLAVTPLPNVPEWVAGVANLRGDIISVVDLRRFLGLGTDESARGGRMLVVRSQSEEIHTALMVDAVRGIRIFNGGRVQQVTAPVETSVAQYMRGVYEFDKGLVVLLDPEKLMLSPEMQQFEAAAAELNHRGRASAQPFDTQAHLTTIPE